LGRGVDGVAAINGSGALAFLNGRVIVAVGVTVLNKGK
jgi:hypothetical protein